MVEQLPMVIDSRHPSYINGMTDWSKWRLTYTGGSDFKASYLEMFSDREDSGEFELRKKITPTPSHAKTAINRIRNAIFQRMRDIVRQGGSHTYREAISGLNLGVDRRGSTMNAFFGVKLLTELLVMGRVGVYVDAPMLPGLATLAQTQGVAPYLYKYDIEDILSWTCNNPERPSEFQTVLLRDTVMDFDNQTKLPVLATKRYRYLWLDEVTGKVHLQFYNTDSVPVDASGIPSLTPITLDITKIPFTIMDIGDSLIKDICDYQIALLNLASSDINYALRANFPFYTQQRGGAVGKHLKQASTDGTASSGGQASADDKIGVGTNYGVYYDKNMERPGFINPSSEPLQASMKLQESYKEDINSLVSLAVANLSSQASGAAKSIDNQGLEAGLSYIGLVLESGERQIAEYWAAYEQRDEKNREIPLITYPSQYSLKTDADRIKEADDLSKFVNKIPGKTVKRELNKNVVTALLGGKITTDKLDVIMKEIDASPYTTSDPDIIILAMQNGACGNVTGSEALGFDGQAEAEKAAADHAARAAVIAQAQSNAGPRGVPDLSGSPQAGVLDKQVGSNTTLKPTTQPLVRGAGQ